MIQSGDATWEKFVPAAAAEIIRQKGLFGLGAGAVTETKEG
jgi:hypothetical protein